MDNKDGHEVEIACTEKNTLNGHPAFNEIIKKESFLDPEVNTASVGIQSNDKPNVQSDISVISQTFKDIYAQRILAIEKNDNLNADRKNEEKLTVLQEHITELQDQNDTFVSTLLELEEEAQQRVKQMEKRLKSSAKTTMEAVVNVHDCAKEMRKIVEERIYVESLYNDIQEHASIIKDENSFLREQNCNLNHDIHALLQVIQHARSTGHWEINCVTFCEVTPEQVFGPVQSISTICHSDSSQLDLQLGTERKVFNSITSEVFDSNKPPSWGEDHQKVEKSRTCLHEFNRHEIHNKDKRIAFLESQLSELMHRLTLKDADCECHLWKLEMLMQQNRTRLQTFPSGLQSNGTSLLKCFSLPEIGNIYSFNHNSRRSHSHGIFNNTRSVCTKAPKIQSVKSVKIKCDDMTDFQRCGPLYTKNDHGSYFGRGQSEPHLFMYGDNIYVYRPCEPIKKVSSNALFDGETILPPCQSIDLKFPTEGSNNKMTDWTALSKSESFSIPPSSHFKDESSCSCTSSDSDIENENKELDFQTGNMKKKYFLSTAIQTDEIVTFSVCLQAAIRREEQSDCMCSCSDPGVNSFDVKKITTLLGRDMSTLNGGIQKDIRAVEVEDAVKEKSFQKDIHQMISIMQTMKENLIKAEDKAAAKEILLAQLQGHLTSAVKEVELKDTALTNLEKKLDISRNESVDLRTHISKLSKELAEMQAINDILLLKDVSKEDMVQEIIQEQKVLQEQKRTLLTQLDAQGDELDKTKQELGTMTHKAESYALQIEQQNQIIKSLQEALVQSKRAFDAAHRKAPLLWEMSSTPLENEVKSSSKSSIVDI